jgi:hypothetical protein
MLAIHLNLNIWVLLGFGYGDSNRVSQASFGHSRRIGIMPTSPESGNAPYKKPDHTVESLLSQSECHHPSDIELLHYMAECPFGLDFLAKTPQTQERLRLALDLWKEAGCPDLEQWRKTLAAGAAQQPPAYRELPARKRPLGAC